MSNHWYVYPLTENEAEWLRGEGVAVPPDCVFGTAPTPDQVSAALRLFPEYRVRVRREIQKKKEKGHDVVLILVREDGSYTVRIRLLGVHSDDRPVGVFCFEYSQETEELVRLVEKVAEVCGPQFLYNDGGCERSILVTPGISPDQGQK